MNVQDKLYSFSNALARLKEAAEELHKNDCSDVIRDGMIQRFEFTYELAWKTTKAYLEDLGIVGINSPKAVIKEAFAQNIIKNEETWLLMIKDRNLTTHVYKEALAKEIATRITAQYIKEFEELLNIISLEF
ncbi:nucleotidyltransferase substrate binding protein (TIGR01987 family) [Desulfitispora alkaliphila]|uniref:nucleotidyltransferase substrate binding protein n=1 Tax=Desulfitispora alkaliphila TaxID=622674 RepID=UPI003D22A8A4